MRKVLALVLFLIFYPPFIVPYVVHDNLATNAGFVEDSKVLPVNSLPSDIRDVVTCNEKCALTLIEDSITKKRTVIITETKSIFKKGDLIEITDRIKDWYIDWHYYDFFGESYDNLVIGSLTHLESFERSIEEQLYSSYGSIIFSISKITFFIAPLFVIYFAYLFKKRFCWWSISVALCLYSLHVFVYNIIGSLHNVPIQDTSKYFGYLFLFLTPTTFLLLRFEESSEGQKKIRDLYDRFGELIDRLF